MFLRLVDAVAATEVTSRTRGELCDIAETVGRAQRALDALLARTMTAIDALDDAGSRGFQT